MRTVVSSSWFAALAAIWAACSTNGAAVDALRVDAATTTDSAAPADARADVVVPPSDVAPTTDSRETGTDGIGRGERDDGPQTDGAWHLDPTQPLATAACPFATRPHPLAPSSYWGANLKRPRPTNAFWMNLVLDRGDERINVMPYHVKALASGLAVSFPRVVSQETSVLTADEPQWILGAAEALESHQVTAYDDLSVTVTWQASSRTVKAPLVYGMPYTSLLYDVLTPLIQTTAGVAIEKVNASSGAGTVTAETLTVNLNNGQTWKIYAPKALTWTWTSETIQANTAFSGWIRIAYVPTATATAALDRHAGAIPTGGSVDLSVVKDEGLVRFDWARTGTGDLLMMAMPHHLARLRSPVTASHTLASLSGTLSSVVGDRWDLRYPLSTITWSAPRPVDADMKADLEAALKADADYRPAETTDPYFGGKQLAKLARLELMAREQGLTTLAASMTDTLATATAAWLDARNANPLVYDTSWGGLVTTKGLADSAADFGQGYYNDHHFHYGYHLYAAAVLARENPAWASSYENKILCLARDIANPSPADSYFPMVRNFDWFVGHSWAAGLFAFGDGRNQESTSEAVNAWYAVELYGRARGNTTLTNLGRILRAMEIASAQTYWQIRDSSTIYPAPFNKHHTVGVLWETKADFTTFFGNTPAFIYGIQMVPFSPASEDLLPRDWIADAASELAAAQAGTTEQGWKGFMTMAQAVIDPAKARSDARALTSYDDGNSRANTLYWIATRPK
jgi:endo-1,3(4)-beta-glucanase